MKILYAIQGTGNGHISRAIALVPEFMKHVEVDVLISGTQSQIEFPFPVKYRFKGLSFKSTKSGGISIWKTLWLINPLRLWKEMKALPVKNYDLVITDFEPISSWASKIRHVKCINLSHQAAVRNPKSPQSHRAFLLGRWIIKHYCPATTSYGFHFESYTENIFLPILRDEVIHAVPKNNGFYVVYLSGYGINQLLDVFKEIDATFILFSKDIGIEEQVKNCRLKPISNDVFLADLTNCKGVICGAGFELPSEALYLNKKLLVVPYSNHYEQYCNAEALSKLGVKVLYKINKSWVEEIRKWCDQEKAVSYSWHDQRSLIIKRILEDQ